MSRDSSKPLKARQQPGPRPSSAALEAVLLRIAGAATKAAQSLSEERTASLPSPRQLVALAGRIYESRRTRDRYFERTLFAEPAWDMLLALYYLPSRGERLTVSALCHASGAPPTTALRWQTELTNTGLIERGPEGVDRRKHLVRLTTEGRTQLEQYLTRILTFRSPATGVPDQP